MPYRHPYGIAVYDTDPRRASAAEKRESRPATGPQDWYPYALAAVVVLGFLRSP